MEIGERPNNKYIESLDLTQKENLLRKMYNENITFAFILWANTATLFSELDDLMTSLNNFKMVDKQVDEPVIPPNLDTMLGNLQVQLCCVILGEKYLGNKGKTNWLFFSLKIMREEWN